METNTLAWQKLNAAAIDKMAYEGDIIHAKNIQRDRQLGELIKENQAIHTLEEENKELNRIIMDYHIRESANIVEEESRVLRPGAADRRRAFLDQDKAGGGKTLKKNRKLSRRISANQKTKRRLRN